MGPYGTSIVVAILMIGVAGAVLECFTEPIPLPSGYPLRQWRLLWRTSLAPIHTHADGSEIEDCQDHECAICLGSICTSAARIAQRSAMRQRAMAPMLSTCRRNGLLSKAGISGARTQRLASAKE